MPNWVTTELSLSSEKNKDLVTLLNTLRKTYDKEPLTSLEDLATDSFSYPLSSIVGKMPDTFKDYDTTNYTAERLREMKEKGIKPFSFPKDKELTEEYIEAFAKAEKEQREKYGVVGWYDYNCKYLGTKWDSDMSGGDNLPTVSLDGNSIFFFFDTAWSPAEPAFKRLAEIISENNLDIRLNILVREESDSFMGTYTNDNGPLDYTEAEYGVNTEDDFFLPWETEEEEEEEEDI